VARDRLAHFCSGILIPIVLATVADENATNAGQLLDQLDTLHGI
jgi:hypothetical protein